MKGEHSATKVILLLAVAGVTAYWSCSGKSETKGTSSTKFDQYYIQGEQLYLTHCSNCHQKTGKGLGLVYPSLDTSDYMDNNFNEVVCLIRHGKQQELVVNGKNFNQPMPGIPSLTDLEIAEISTYIYNTWTHKRGLVDVKETSKILEECK
ncbi:MAG: c-type cytochrome [Bacteroidota bacterium]